MQKSVASSPTPAPPVFPEILAPNTDKHKSACHAGKEKKNGLTEENHMGR